MRADDETSMPNDPDGLFDDQDMPAADGEMADGAGAPEDAQPESQGEDPLEIDLGEEGQGDLAPEDE